MHVRMYEGCPEKSSLRQWSKRSSVAGCFLDGPRVVPVTGAASCVCTVTHARMSGRGTSLLDLVGAVPRAQSGAHAGAGAEQCLSLLSLGFEMLIPGSSPRDPIQGAWVQPRAGVRGSPGDWPEPRCLLTFKAFDPVA